MCERRAVGIKLLQYSALRSQALVNASLRDLRNRLAVPRMCRIHLVSHQALAPRNCAPDEGCRFGPLQIFAVGV